MAAPVCGRDLKQVLSWSRELPCVWRALHTSAVCAKNRAARVRVGKGDKPVSYEEAHPPHHIAHRKGWLSLHTGGPVIPKTGKLRQKIASSRLIWVTATLSKKELEGMVYAYGPSWEAEAGILVHGNLDGEDHAAERTVEDVFLRKFMLGTFPGCLADQVVLKRRANHVEICALVLRQLPVHKLYFLVGYSETLLSHFYKCPVRLHLQTVPSKVVYKYI